jgi:hypothetical protein
MQGAQIESAVEAAGERGEVAGRILAEIECMAAAAQAGLEIAWTLQLQDTILVLTAYCS